MQTVGKLPRRFQLAVLMLAITAIAGCAVPSHVGRCYVSGELVPRAGAGLPMEDLSCGVLLPPDMSLEDPLSEDDAVLLALWNNPDFRALLVDLQITQADLIQAHLIVNPEVQTLFPLAVKQWELVLWLPVDALIVRPRRVAAAQLENHRVADRLVQDGLNVVRDARQAFLRLKLAEGQLLLAEQGLQLRDEITRIAEARLEAGEASELDVSATRLNSLFGRELVYRYRQEVELAREQLRYLVGLATTPSSVQTADPPDLPVLAFDVEQLVAEAHGMRPDLRAIDLALGAARERATLARYDYLNIWAGAPDLNGEGENGFNAGPGLRMSLPIFNQNQGAKARAAAEVERLQREYSRLQDTISREVRQAYTRLEQAQAIRTLWREQLLPAAAEATEIARNALAQDGVTPLLVLETSRQLLTAQQQELLAAMDVRLALAELERCVGRGLADRAGDIPSAEGELAIPPTPVVELPPSPLPIPEMLP